MAGEDVEKMIDLIPIVNTDFSITFRAHNWIESLVGFNSLLRLCRQLRQVRISILFSMFFLFALRFRQNRKSQNLVGADDTVYDKHCAVLMLVRGVS
jgi:hypothetical protein